MLDLKRREAACISGNEGVGGDLYAALLDDYEPNESPAYLDEVFAQLKGPLVDLVGRHRFFGENARS